METCQNCQTKFLDKRTFTVKVPVGYTYTVLCHDCFRCSIKFCLICTERYHFSTNCDHSVRDTTDPRVRSIVTNYLAW